VPANRTVIIRRSKRIPALLLVLGSISSVQLGSAFAKTLFSRVGPTGVVMLALTVGAIFLCATSRPRLAGHGRRQLALAAGFGLVLASMYLTFYAAIARIPIGVAVTVEFCGPLAVAIAGSRRWLDAAWAILAGAGVALLTRGGGPLNPAGLAFAGLAGAGWACYILLSQRVGRAFARRDGLALASVVGAAVVLPAGLVGAGSALLDWRVVATGAGVGILASAIPYSLELEALRRLPARVFGVLMSLEPAAGALAGLLVLGQRLLPAQIAAMALVSAASAGAAWTDRSRPPRRQPDHDPPVAGNDQPC
jgi:inner membrane transporter RhtA